MDDRVAYGADRQLEGAAPRVICPRLDDAEDRCRYYRDSADKRRDYLSPAIEPSFLSAIAGRCLLTCGPRCWIRHNRMLPSAITYVQVDLAGADVPLTQMGLASLFRGHCRRSAAVSS